MIDHEHRKVGRVCHWSCCVGHLPFLECAYTHLTNKLIILLQGTELTDGILVPTLNHWNTYICNRPTQIQVMEKKLSMHINQFKINHRHKKKSLVEMSGDGGDEMNTWCLYIAHQETPGWHFRIYPSWFPPAGSCERGCLMIKDPKHPMTSGSSLRMRPSFIQRCIQ